VRYNELLGEIVVFRSDDDSFLYWADIKAKIIAILIEFLPSKMPGRIDDNDLADHWTKEDKLIDDIIILGLTPIMKETHSGRK
jgi:hypothetical protein